MRFLATLTPLKLYQLAFFGETIPAITFGLRSTSNICLQYLELRAATVYLYAMKRSVPLVLLLAAMLMNFHAQSPTELSDIWEKEHVSTKFPSDVRHKDLQVSLEALKTLGVKVQEVGRSYANREIYQIEWGRGPKKVFMWSQMHGNEPTATTALIDMFTIFQKNRDKPWVQKIENEMTIRAVPMLNPDGSESFVRANLQGIDINRDALNLKTPEGRLLKSLRDAWSPEIGFNLHNQRALTSAGQSNKQAAISFMVVYGDEEKTKTPGQERNTRLVSAMNRALNTFIPGNIARYSDDWTFNAFGDNFSAWGTPTILIETGGLHGKDEMYLVKMNFVAMVTALDLLATGNEAKESPEPYEALPENTAGRLIDIVFRHATISNSNGPTNNVVDIAAESERRRASFTPYVVISEIVRNSDLSGLDEYDASGFYVVHRFGRLKPAELAELHFYRKGRAVEWSAPDLESRFPPDAVFSLGKWFKGKGVVPKIEPK